VRKDGTVVFAAPVGNGHAPFIALKDIAFWTRKTFDNPDTMTGNDLEIVSEVVNWPTIVETFTRVTGRPAEYKSVTMDEFFDLFENADVSAATNAARPTGSWRKTFGGLFALMRDDIVKRDTEWAKSIHPKTTTLEQWMRETQYDGGYQALLKLVGACQSLTIDSVFHSGVLMRTV
jgi:NmrA-like family